MKNEEITVHLTELRKDVAFIKKAIEGNGHKGILDRLSGVEKFQNVTTGGLILLSALISYGLIKGF